MILLVRRYIPYLKEGVLRLSIDKTKHVFTILNKSTTRLSESMGMMPTIHARLDAAEEHEETRVVPPRRDAVAWEDGHPHNEVLTQIKEKGLENWKDESGYHRRSIAENTRYQLKQLFGDKLASRICETQIVGVHTHIAAINIITYLGIPVSVRVATTASHHCLCLYLLSPL